MKSIYKFLMLAVIVTGAVSCEDSDLIIDEVYDTVDTETGAIVRTVEAPLDLVTGTGDNNSIDFVWEIQQGNGSIQPDFKELRVLVRTWQDQDLIDPLVDGNGNPIPEAVYAVIPASAFEIGENGLPRIAFSIPTADLVAWMPEDAVYTVPSFVNTRLELEMNDGTVFDDSKVGATIAGIYFSSPYSYRTIFINDF